MTSHSSALHEYINWTQLVVLKMCILFMFNGTHDAKSEYSLVLVSNRDEYYDRPAQNMAPWKEDPNVYGGRDLEYAEGGTWLAVSPTRSKLGVLLNLAGSSKPLAKSRGRIVADYIKCEKPVRTYIQLIRNYAMDCNDFVFVSVEFKSAGPTISSYSNATDDLTIHKEAYLGFGNSLPETPLKKVDAGKAKLMQILNTFNKVSMQEELLEKLIELLKSEEKHLPDHELETKRPKLYKELSSIFVSIPKGKYGTRTHTIVLVTKTGHMKVIELTLDQPIHPTIPFWIKHEYDFEMELK